MVLVAKVPIQEICSKCKHGFKPFVFDVCPSCGAELRYPKPTVKKTVTKTTTKKTKHKK